MPDPNDEFTATEKALVSLVYKKSINTKTIPERIDKAFALIAAANTVSILSLDEMQQVVLSTLKDLYEEA